VPTAPAGANDITARLIGQWLWERLGQQFVIDNRPGGGADIGTEAVVHAPADGYTLLMVGGYYAINATLYQKLNFNFIRDIAPVATLGGGAGCGPLCATRIGPSYITCAGPDQNGARSTRAALGGRAGRDPPNTPLSKMRRETLAAV